MTKHVISISGGKDSTALLLLAIVLHGAENLIVVFADTGHEHPETYAYVRYLERELGVKIIWVKADLSRRIAAKRTYIIEKWPGEGVPQTIIDQALAVLHPTGNPFLDLCLWKGRFPSTRARFCTEELKRNPIIEQIMIPLMETGDMILSWQGVRADESPARKYLPECDEVGGGLFNYRPILKWSVESVFEAHDCMGIEPNPLYKKGMGRVGCMPCVNCNKAELAHIATRFPEEIARVREWERIVSLASRRGSTTFFTATTDPTVSGQEDIHYSTHGIDRMVDWAKTERGGRQFGLIPTVDVTKSCSSIYGLCE